MYVCFSRNTKHAEFQMISFDNDKAIYIAFIFI